MGFTEKDWRNATTHAGGGDESTPISAVALEDLETRVTDYADLAGGNIFNVMAPPYNAVGDGGTDDTTGIQGAIDDAGAVHGAVHFPATADFYKVTDSLILSDYGLSLFGAGREASIIKQATDNTPVFKATGMAASGHSIRMNGLGIGFVNAQPAANTSAYGVMLGDADADYYYWTLSDLRFTRCFTGIGVEQNAGTIVVWNNSLSQLLFGEITGSLINFVPEVGAGNPVNTFRQITCLNDGTTPTQEALRLQGEWVINGLDIEAWQGPVMYADSGFNCVLNGAHLERHSITQNYQEIFHLADGCYTVNGVTAEIYADDATPCYLISGNGSSKIFATGLEGTRTSGGGPVYLASPTDGDQFILGAWRASTAGVYGFDEYQSWGTGGNYLTLLSQQSVLTNVGASGMRLPIGKVVKLSGTDNITSIAAQRPGAEVTIIFTDTASGTGLTDGNNLKLAGNFVYTPDDTITLACDGTDWYEVARSVN